MHAMHELASIFGIHAAGIAVALGAGRADYVADNPQRLATIGLTNFLMAYVRVFYYFPRFYRSKPTAYGARD